MTATSTEGAESRGVTVQRTNTRAPSRTTAVPRSSTAPLGHLGELVERIAHVMNLQAVNSQWRDRVQLVPGFAEDVARNVVAGIVDQFAEVGAERNARTHRK